MIIGHEKGERDIRRIKSPKMRIEKWISGTETER